MLSPSVCFAAANVPNKKSGPSTCHFRCHDTAMRHRSAHIHGSSRRHRLQHRSNHRTLINHPTVNHETVVQKGLSRVCLAPRRIYESPCSIITSSQKSAYRAGYAPPLNFRGANDISRRKQNERRRDSPSLNSAAVLEFPFSIWANGRP